jgi:hypothetical protein
MFLLGVYTTTVDSQQHKVTVTGNVEADTLIKKLLRSGKHAELWPEKKKSGKQKNNEKPKDQKNIEEDGGDGEPKTADSDGGEMDNEDGENEEGGGEINGGGGGGEGAGKKKKKKKKKKAQTGNPTNAGGERPGESPAGNFIPGALPDLTPPMAAMNLSPPRQQVYPYPPPMINYPTPPPYGMSYNTAYPTTSTASYYVLPMHANTYSHSEFYPPAAASYPIDHHPFNDDDDESGCSIM